MAGGAYPDAQPKGTHLDPVCDIREYSTDQLTAYWAMVYAIAVIAGIAGTDDEKKAARKAVEDALKDAVETAGSFGKAAQIAVDDYAPPLPILAPATSGGQRVIAGAARGVGEWFGVKSPALDQHIENLDQQIRDQTAVKVNRSAGLRKTVKGWVGADTSEEDRQIAATQQVADARRAEVGAAFDRIWNGIKEVALARYNQFVKERNACGVGYALQTLGVDGSFLVVETVVTVAAGAVTGGAGAVALRISVTAGQKAGKIIVKISRAGRKVKHGGPNEGVLPLDKGNVEAFGKAHNGYGDDLGSHTNTPAKQEPGGPDSGKKKVSNKAIGDAAEAQAKKDLAAKGFTDQKTITNPQGNDVDIIARNPSTGEVMFGEVKGNTARLSTDQSFRGGPDYVRNRL